MQRANLQALFSKLQARYPTASLVSELLRVHSGSYVVRASIQLSGNPLATGMAAAPQLELAEDQAMLRALMLVGIQTESSLPTQLPAISPLPPTVADSLGEEMVEVQSIAMPLTNFSSGNHLSTFLPDTTPVKEVTEVEPVTFSSSPEIEEIQESYPEAVVTETSESEPSLTTEVAQPAPKPRTKSRTQSPSKLETQPIEEIAEPAVSVTEPVDFSDPIAQIDTEMMRAGWTKEQGRDYLKTTYKKRSRQQLSDDELLDFLSHLQSLPSAVQTPF